MAQLPKNPQQTFAFPTHSRCKSWSAGAYNTEPGSVAGGTAPQQRGHLMLSCFLLTVECINFFAGRHRSRVYRLLPNLGSSEAPTRVPMAFACQEWRWIQEHWKHYWDVARCSKTVLAVPFQFWLAVPEAEIVSGWNTSQYLHTRFHNTIRLRDDSTPLSILSTSLPEHVGSKCRPLHDYINFFFWNQVIFMFSRIRTYIVWICSQDDVLAEKKKASKAAAKPSTLPFHALLKG